MNNLERKKEILFKIARKDTNLYTNLLLYTIKPLLSTMSGDIVIDFEKLKEWKKENKRHYKLTQEELTILKTNKY